MSKRESKAKIYTNQFRLRGIHVKVYIHPDGTQDSETLCINRRFTYGSDIQRAYLKAVYRVMGENDD
jgi:hypothetical protein